MKVATRPHPLLIPAGVTLLAICHLLTLDGQAFARGSWAEVVGLAVGYTVLGAGLCVGFIATDRRGAGLRPRTAAPVVVATSGDAARLPAAMLDDFQRWISEPHDDTSLWGAFDQQLRESLSTHLHAGRVRCFRVVTPNGTLRPLGRAHGAADVTPAESPLLCHVAVTGAAYVRREADPESALAELARSDREPWDWVLRIDSGGGPVGVVALVMGEGRGVPGRSLRELIASLMTLEWRCVASHELLRLATTTDKASGVMTRSDFFEAGEEALRQAAAEREPCVVMAMVIEGLRRLDDVGQWAQRDRLVSQLGHTLSQRTRRDDVIGRFSDDRFVILLRRMDLPLGRLLAEKIQGAACALAQALFGAEHALGFRVGLAGGEMEPAELREMLVTAFEAAERARHERVTVCAGERSELVLEVP